jgi:hypothetical protein
MQQALALVEVFEILTQACQARTCS